MTERFYLKAKAGPSIGGYVRADGTFCGNRRFARPFICRADALEAIAHLERREIRSVIPFADTGVDWICAQLAVVRVRVNEGPSKALKRPMTLGAVNDALDSCGAERVRLAAPMAITPIGVSSYRGYYDDLAIEYEEGGEGMPLPEFMALLRAADGAYFTGYKGGEYRMGRHSAVWVSNYGVSSGARVVGVETEDDTAYLLVTVRRWK